jgi:hypothetical protein
MFCSFRDLVLHPGTPFCELVTRSGGKVREGTWTLNANVSFPKIAPCSDSSIRGRSVVLVQQGLYPSDFLADDLRKGKTTQAFQRLAISDLSPLISRPDVRTFLAAFPGLRRCISNVEKDVLDYFPSSSSSRETASWHWLRSRRCQRFCRKTEMVVCRIVVRICLNSAIQIVNSLGVGTGGHQGLLLVSSRQPRRYRSLNFRTEEFWVLGHCSNTWIRRRIRSAACKQ